MVESGERLLVWGAGGHGRVVADVAVQAGHRVLGFVDRDHAALQRVAGNGLLLLGETEMRDGLRSSDGLHGVTAIALGIGDNRMRSEGMALLGPYLSPALIHPRAVVAPGVVLGRGTVVMAGVLVNVGARTGEGVILNSGAVIEHDCMIGAGAHISPGATLAGGVSVGERGWVGAAATVLPGASIGNDAVLGAGAVLLGAMPPGSVYVGVPARPIERRLP